MNKEKKEISLEKLISLFQDTQTAMQNQAARTVNSSLVFRNWLFGWYIAEFEKQSSNRTEIYGKKLILNLSAKLTPKIRQTLFAQTSHDLKAVVHHLFKGTELNEKKIGQAFSAQFLSNLSLSLISNTSSLEAQREMKKKENDMNYELKIKN